MAHFLAPNFTEAGAALSRRSRVPLIVTVAPRLPAAGLNLVMAGAGMTVKLAALVPVPPGVVTAIGPLVAPAGTVAVICASDVHGEDRRGCR